MKWYALAALICGLALGSRGSLAGDGKDAKAKKGPSIGELMAQSHKGDNSPLMKLDQELRAAQLAWGEVRKHADALVRMKTAMEKHGRFLGNRDGKGYIDSVAALDAAIQKKDQAATTTAFARIKSSCASCHYQAKF